MSGMFPLEKMSRHGLVSEFKLLLSGLYTDSCAGHE